MFRRDFFKMLGTLAGSAMVAPLAKLLPEPKPSEHIAIARITHFADVDFALTDVGLAISLEDFSERYIRPAIKRLADTYDAEHGLRIEALKDLKYATGNSWLS